MNLERIPSTTNFNRLNKDAILWLYNHSCKHRHRFSEHPTCFLEKYKDQLATIQRIAIIDIETTNLNADFGYILCYSLKELDGELIHRCVTPQEIKSSTFDKNIVRQFLKDIKEYDNLVTYYGSRFDLPYIRTRALRWGFDFPGWGDYLSTDVYYIAKAKLRTHRKRLETVCDLLGIPSKAHRLNPEVWMKAQAGSKRALDYISLHCDEDVLSLEAVYKRLVNFRGQSKTSI